LSSIGIFVPVLLLCTKKNLATLSESTFWNRRLEVFVKNYSLVFWHLLITFLLRWNWRKTSKRKE
jgi:hypothetical protein